MILHKVYNNAEECIVKEGDPGIAMYILVEGTAKYTKGSKWLPEPDSKELRATASKRALLPKPSNLELSPGSSFGEEILFGFRESYSYTIVSISECHLHTISEDDFIGHFKN